MASPASMPTSSPSAVKTRHAQEPVSAAHDTTRQQRLEKLARAAREVFFSEPRPRRLSLLRVIRAKCMDCASDQRSLIRECPSRACPLWPYRSGMRPETAKQKGWQVE